MAALLSECKIATSKIAIKHRDTGSDSLCWRGPHAAHLDKKFQTYIVQNKRAQNRERIAPQLTALTKLSSLKCHITIEPETSKKGDRKDNNERGDVGRHNHHTQIDKALGYDKMVDNEIPHQIEHHITTPTSSVSENLTREDFPKRLDVEDVDETTYGLS